MTVHELRQLALQRNRTLQANPKGFSVSRLRYWLDQQVQAGLLEKRRGRYYLTHDGWWIAICLAGQLP